MSIVSYRQIDLRCDSCKGFLQPDGLVNHGQTCENDFKKMGIFCIPLSGANLRTILLLCLFDRHQSVYNVLNMALIQNGIGMVALPSIAFIGQNIHEVNDNTEIRLWLPVTHEPGIRHLEQYPSIPFYVFPCLETLLVSKWNSPKALLFNRQTSHKVNLWLKCSACQVFFPESHLFKHM